MKIKRIELYNVGPYVGQNVFDFSISDKNRNIVLIGGKNGAGKTTFFNSIKICLFGCKALGYDAPGKEYFAKIDKLVNKGLQYNNLLCAYIEVEIDINNGKEDIRYLIHREWQKTSKGFSEQYFVYKNDIKLTDDELIDFTNFIFSTMSPDMFNFYFFNGESIAEYFLGNDGGKNFKNAFLKLYGLDTLSIMVDNFIRCFKKNGGKSTAFDLYLQSKEALEVAIKEYTAAKEKLNRYENMLDLCTIKHHTLQNNYKKNGGISLTEWKEINANLLKEEALREEINRWIKYIANNYLPFIIIRKQLNELLVLIKKENTMQRNMAIQEIIQDKGFVDGLGNLLLSYNIKSLTSNDIVDYIKKQFGLTNQLEGLFDFSLHQTNKLIDLIDEKNLFNEDIMRERLRELNKSLLRSKRLREKLASSSIDEFETYTRDCNKVEQEAAMLRIEIEKSRQLITTKEEMLALAKIKFTKARDDYELMLKKKSINELSARAIAAYSLLEDKLIRQQCKKLEDEFARCFSSIINKENFLDGIVIDKNINVIPYKYSNISLEQIDNYMSLIKKSGFLELFDEEKVRKAIYNLRMGYVETIKLPSPINAPFSQGERQVFIMSLYLALLKTSNKALPFFIDTPFSRIDSNHRSSIIREFFLGIHNQMFILSTDEEFVGKYKEMIDEKISDTFILSIDGYGKSKVIRDNYFEV